MHKVLTPISELSGQPRKTWVVVGGVIDSTKKKITRAGKAMMFVTIQDVTGPLELLVFPKTYETTKDVWVEGRTVCVVGKTGEEEGDDKLFVEKAYELTKENVGMITAQMGVNAGAPSIRSYVPPEVVEALQDEGVTIELTNEQVKKYSEDIKKILAKYPGEKLVYLKVGDKKIKTSFKVGNEEKVRAEVGQLLND